MRIIKATINEIADIVSLNSHVQKIHHETHPDIFKPVPNDQSGHKFFANLIAQESNTFLVAYIDSVAVGYAWYAVEEKPEFPLKFGRTQIYIHQIAVDESYRRQNIGRSLFSEIENVAKKLGISHFELDSWSFNTEAHAFFNRLGFETYNINMWRKP